MKINVALLAEGVDRNFQRLFQHGRFQRSPSSRRAWIEIYKLEKVYTQEEVALLAEGVDRNVLWPAS